MCPGFPLIEVSDRKGQSMLGPTLLMVSMSKTHVMCNVQNSWNRKMAQALVRLHNRRLLRGGPLRSNRLLAIRWWGQQILMDLDQYVIGGPVDQKKSTTFYFHKSYLKVVAKITCCIILLVFWDMSRAHEANPILVYMSFLVGFFCTKLGRNRVTIEIANQLATPYC